MSAPRGLSAEEAEAWEKVAATVEPMHKGPAKQIAATPAPASAPATVT